MNYHPNAVINLIFWAFYGAPAAHPLAVSIISILWIIGWFFLLRDCLKIETGIDRLTWVIVLLFAPFGSVFYFARAVNRN